MLIGLFIGIIIASLLVALNNKYDAQASSEENKARSAIRIIASVITIVTVCTLIGYIISRI